MSGSIQVSIDHRCELGTSYSLAERGHSAYVKNSTRCTVSEDCGAEIPAGGEVFIWYFTRRGDNNTVVGTLCSRCDAEMIEVADSEVNA
jgi:hypothetical protein